MSDRIFLRLNDRLALGADDLQWILYRSRAAAAPDMCVRNWLPIAYVSSSREVLARCVRETGFGDDTAMSAVLRLEAAFDAWKAAVAPARAAPEPELEPS
jgi:hypothetical protein